MERGRLLDVLDAAYDLNAPADRWQARIVEGVQRSFSECDGVLSFRYQLQDGAPNLTSEVIGDPRYMAVPDDGHMSMDMQAIFRAYMAPSHAEPTTLFHADPVTGQAPEALLRMWERHGVRDMFGVYATRPLGESLTIGIALPRATTPEIRAVDWRARRHAWGSVARHLENALVIRDVLARGASADFELSGKGDFSGAAVEKREELVETARALEHHRDAAHQGNDESLDAWSRLLKGEWSIVRYQRDNGRMRYLAVENPEGDTLRALTPLEADIVTRAAAGQPNKVMALELELHESTVANVLATGLRKLGLERRTHLPMLQRLLATQR
ncbi:MAG: hypothetical protein JNJ54_03175 [Myxococcaceae bacterium]|nr:hypothetical protein [Myxococcaceae bacterium]